MNFSGAQAYPKVVLLGDTSVGKTSLIRALSQQPFVPDSPPTIGANFTIVDIPGSQTGPIRIWDTAGQEHYRAITSLYYRDAELIVLVFAVNVRQTFESVPLWIEHVKDTCARTPAMILVGNKADTRYTDDSGCVSSDEVLELTETEHVEYLETSAKTGEGVTDLFQQAAVKAYDNWESSPREPQIEEPPLVHNETQNCMGCSR
jgi:small GTP-binding protein